MNLEEAIKHCDEVAKENYLQGMLCHANPNDEHLDNCIECAKQHEQLKTWLIEYKKLAEENNLLKREVKALDEEGVQKCELNEKLSKALDKACKELANAVNFKEKYCSETLYRTNDKTFEKWREWCMKDE